MSGDDENEDQMKRMVRWSGGQEVGWVRRFDNDDEGWDTRFECGTFFLFFFFSFLFFLLFLLAFLSPAHIQGEKSGSVGSTY